MGTITAVLVLLSFVSGCVTLVVGYRLGHDEATLTSHLSWAMVTLLLQFAAACIAIMHARAEKRYVSSLENALAQAAESARGDVENGGSA